MNRLGTPAFVRCILFGVCLLTAASAVADDSLATARDLYASAAYEDALAVLNRLRPAAERPGEGGAIDQYRAFCLLALGRTAEAEHAIEAVIVAEPSYRPSEADVSPRVRSAFSEVRRRVLPGIVQEQYAAAKTTFDRKEFATAAGAFRRVLDAMADPDVVAAASQPPLSDLRTLAVGFLELSMKAVAPPPPPPAPSPQPVAPPPPAPVAPVASIAPRIYTAEDPRVTPPAIVNQTLPMYPTRPVPSGRGVLEIVVDERGAVESAVVRSSINNLYDRMALTAARNWRYKPATVDGEPVKFRKSIMVTLSPQQPGPDR